MKKTAALFLCFVMLLSMLPGVSASALVGKSEPLKILAIGNSYSVDAMNYLYGIAKTEGADEVVLGILYQSGCSLSTHWSNAQSNKAAYTYYKNDSGTWHTTPGTTMISGIQDEDWDIISLQEASASSGLAETYYTMDYLLNYVSEHTTNPETKFIWHMTWAYQNGYTGSTYFVKKYHNNQTYMYECIANAVQSQVLTRPSISRVIPVGTAIQNARTSFLGDTLNRDGTHLTPLGRVIAAYTWYAALTGKPVQNVSLEDPSIDLSYSDKLLIKECVNNAINAPYTVTPSAYTERLDPKTIDLTDGIAAVAGQKTTSATKGSEVTITYIPSSAEHIFDRWQIVSGSVSLANPTSPTTTFTMPDEPVSIQANYTVSCPSEHFSDVNSFKWYHQAIDYALTNGLMSGYNSERFGPSDNLSRAMVVQVLYNKEGQPAVSAANKFPDVSVNDWFCNAVRWGADKGVVGGYGNGRFGPNDNVTIEQVAVILWNYSGNPTPTGDAGSVGTHSDWAANALSWAVANDVLKGVPYDCVTDPATRAQTAQMLMNYLSK